MEIKQLLQAHCLFILTHFISAQSEVTLDDEKKNIYVSPGSDVNLTCTIQKEKRAYISQTQWSKIVDGKPERLVVYNPSYGTTYSSSLEKANSSASFKNAARCDQSDSSRIRDSNAECNQWILQLRNVSLEWAGVYECSFAIFPAGIKTSEIHLIIKQDDEKTYVVEILLNQTLEIPCFQDKPSANLDKAPLTWLMQEEDGTEVILITKEYYYQTSYVTNATKYKERIKMDPDNTLKISPILVIDNGKKFICSIAEHPGRTMKSITEVKVFVKPEIAIYPSSAEKDSLTCVIRKAFPNPNLMWFVDGKILNNKSEGIFIENEVTKDAEGFYKLRSQLTTGSTTTSSISQTFKCMSLYPFLGNEIWNVSAEETVLPFGFQTMSSPFLDLISQTVPVSNSHTEQYQATSSPSLELSSQIAPTSDSPTEGFQMTSSTSLETRTQVTPVSNFHMERSSHSPKNVPNETNTTLSSYSTVPQSNPSIRRVTEFTLTSRGNLSTLKRIVVLSGDTSPGHIIFSWPAIVSSMLLICTVLIIVAIQKWCHYQKEIMNRPPSFKPLPPPIKYTAMHDTDGIYPSCNELENL